MCVYNMSIYEPLGMFCCLFQKMVKDNPPLSEFMHNPTITKQQKIGKNIYNYVYTVHVCVYMYMYVCVSVSHMGQPISFPGAEVRASGKGNNMVWASSLDFSLANSIPTLILCSSLSMRAKG